MLLQNYQYPNVVVYNESSLSKAKTKTALFLFPITHLEKKVALFAHLTGKYSQTKRPFGH